MPRGSRASQPEEVYRFEITGTVDLRTGEIRFGGHLKAVRGFGVADACQADDRARPEIPASEDVQGALQTQRKRLTAREMEVVRLLTYGLSNSDVARRLGISPHTARRHTERVLFKLGLHSRAQVGARMLGDQGGSGPVDLAERVIDRPVESEVEAPPTLRADREVSEPERRL